MQRLTDAGLALLVAVAVAAYATAAVTSCASTHAVSTVSGVTTADAPATPGPPAEDALPRPVLGVSINLYHLDDPAPLTAAIDRIADLGFNTLQVVTPVFQRDGAAAAPARIVARLHGPTDDTLRLALTHARQRGLTTALMMQVNFTHPRGNEWRGKLLPPDWPTWWAGYRDALAQYADLAAESNADALSVGCELLTTQQPQQADAWAETIAIARERFSGTLYYSTNWDAYASFPSWHELDVIGISGYWDLTRTAANRDRTTDAEVLDRWQRIRRELDEYATRLDMPLLVTEVGYPALPWALRDPWNYLLGDGTLDTAAQARAYRLLAEAWAPALAEQRSTNTAPTDRLAGLVLYEWDLYHDPATHTGYALDRPATLDALAPLLDTVRETAKPTP
ncbi:MAG: hypothetical protein AAGB29_00195 [Planctomycetota bacterium]